MIEGSDKQNPFATGGMPLTEKDFTKDSANKKSDLLSSLQLVKQIHEKKKTAQQNSNNISASSEIKSNAVNLSQQSLSQNNLTTTENIDTKPEAVVETKPTPAIEPKPASQVVYEVKKTDTDIANNLPKQAAGITTNLLDEDNLKSLQNKDEKTTEYLTSYQTENQTVDNSQFTPFNLVPDEPIGDANVNVDTNNPNATPAHVVNENNTPINSGDLNQMEVFDSQPKMKPVYAVGDDTTTGKKYAWLAYILFFLPALFGGFKNQFARHHMNEGLETNIIDLIGIIGLLVWFFVKTTNEIVSWVLLVSLSIGVVLLTLTTITKLFMIIASLCGKTPQTPWLWKIKIIK